MRRIGVVVVALLATTLVGCGDDERKKPGAAPSSAVPGPVPLTKKQARRALITPRNVGEGSHRYRYAAPYITGCLGLIESPMDTIQAEVVAEAGYDGDLMPAAHELIRSYRPQIDVEQAFADIGKEIAKCDDINSKVDDDILIEMFVGPTRRIKGLPRGVQHSYAAVGTVTMDGEKSPLGYKVTYLLTGTTITRVSTKFPLPAVRYHDAMTKIAYQRLKAVVSGKKLSRKVAPPVPRR